jgi:hypothetical protein
VVVVGAGDREGAVVFAAVGLVAAGLAGTAAVTGVFAVDGLRAAGRGTAVVGVVLGGGSVAPAGVGER